MFISKLIMLMSKNDILEHIYNNKMLNDAIKNIVAPQHYQDFRSHFYLQVAELDENKLIQLYNKNELDYFCLKIITNQYKSKTSTFHKLYKNGGMPGTHTIDVVDMDEWLKNNTIIDEKEIKGPDPVVIKKQILYFLEVQYDNIIANQYHKVLFMLYYFDDLTLKQIEETTKINKDAVSRSVRKTKAYLKTKIKL